MTDHCPLCAKLAAGDTVLRSARAAALADAFPVSDGHTLVVPVRHVADYFDLTPEERGEVVALIQEVKDLLAARVRPDGYNIGINVGAAAGQTVPHAHVHVIPRYAGDTADPRGGLRWVFPDRARYWSDRDE